MISPLDFMCNPILWIELMSKLKVNWTVAPNFAYRLVARKFMALRKKNPSFGTDLDLSSIVQVGCAAEPIQTDTKNIFEEAFTRFGLREQFFCPGYGLAEAVVVVTIQHEYKLSRSRKFVAVGKRENYPDGQVIKIVCPDTNEELPDGQVGEIWIFGPSVAKGYFGKPELSIETFQAKLFSQPESDMRYLRTGDLGFYEDDYLYVCGRQKDVIIVNGHNYYPQDIESEVQNASQGVRPGCVAAFSRDERGAEEELEIVFEIRKSHEMRCDEVVMAVHNAITQVVRLSPSRIVAIKERRILKTTSGKIRRNDNRKALHDGLFVKYVVSDWNKHSIIAPEEFSTEVFPEAAVRAVQQLQSDPVKLEQIFVKFRVDTLIGLREAWDRTDKSTTALQNMCKDSMSGVTMSQPTTVQFARLLAMKPEWILVDGMEFLSDVVHNAFVLEWITRKVADNVDLLEKKLQVDDEHERVLLHNIDLESSTLPEDARFLADGQTHDALFGAVDIFAYMKMRSVRKVCYKCVNAIKEASIANFFGLSKKSNDEKKPLSKFLAMEGEEISWFDLNVLEAIWVDFLHCRHSNITTGQWIISRSRDSTVIVRGDKVIVVAEQSSLWSVYSSWKVVKCNLFCC